MARLGLGLGAGSGARRRRGGTPVPTPPPGTAATAFAAAPTVHYHFASQTPSLDGAGRLASCPDLRGLAALAAVAGTTAPMAMTDALGRTFLRFNGSEAAAIGAALAVASNRGFMALAVGRMHHGGNTCQFVNPRWATYAGPASNTAANASIGYLRATVTSNSAPFLQGGNPAGSSNAADCHRIVPGCQLQVMAVASRTTAGGGTRLYLNADTCDVAQQSTGVSNYLGIVVGGSAGAANSETVSAGADSIFDLYELAFWNTGPANAAADAAVAATVANYAIPPLDTNLMLEGDSITYGVATALPDSPAHARGLGSRLTEPGSPLIPPNVRVINRGASGAKVANLVARRDAANSVYAAARYPGGSARNIVAIQIGRNDVFDTATTAAAHYAGVAALLHTAGSGVLQRGWRVVQAGNIAGPNTAIPGGPPDGPITAQQRIEAFRAMVFSGTAIHPGFANDTASAPGQEHDGLVTVLPLHEITQGGDTRFRTAADAGDMASGCYDSDNTHLRVAGIDLMADGGDTPAHGYGAIA